MSEKIKQLLETLLDHCDNFYREDPRECMDPLSGMDQCKAEILAEFAKLNAVREKLAEAAKGMLAAFEYDGTPQVGAIYDAKEHLKQVLAANAELEGK